MDTYDRGVLDEEDYDEMAPEERAEAERLMRKRDRDEAVATGRMRPGLLYGECQNMKRQIGKSQARTLSNWVYPTNPYFFSQNWFGKSIKFP